MSNTGSNQSVAQSRDNALAARLAGLPAGRLRVCKRRYDNVSPIGRHRYALDVFNRPAQVKAMGDVDYLIGPLVHPPLATSYKMRAAPAAGPACARPREHRSAASRVAIVCEALAARAEAAAQSLPSLQIIAVRAEWAKAVTALRSVVAGLLAIDMAVLREDVVETIDTLAASARARRAAVAYRFANEEARRELRRCRHAFARAPLDLTELVPFGAATQVAGGVAAALPAPAAPRFDEHALARLAQASSTVRCKRQRHVVELVLSLDERGRYSGECGNRSPPNARPHRYLGNVAGGAQTLLEEALARVEQAEGITLAQAGFGAKG